MFKVVREYVETPIFLIICDNRNCAAMARGEADLSNPDNVRLSQTSFIKQAAKDGWSIGMDAQLCPGHTAVMKEMGERAKAKSEQIVKPAGLADVLKFEGGGGGRGRRN